jgi:hypothetical protein
MPWQPTLVSELLVKLRRYSVRCVSSVNTSIEVTTHCCISQLANFQNDDLVISVRG